MKTRREVFIYEHAARSKAIVNPRKVDLMTIHYVKVSYKRKSKLYVVDPSVAVLHHYRNKEKSSNWVVDRTMFKYSKDLIGRMSKLHV